MRSLTALGLAVVLAGSAISQPALGQGAFGKVLAMSVMLKTCASLEDPDIRLACYDEIGKTLPQPGDDQPQSTAGEIDEGALASAVDEPPTWRVTHDRSKIDDSETVALWINPAQPIHNDYGSPLDAYFAIVCEENSTRAFVFADRFLGSGSASVTYRLDSDPAARIHLRLSTDNQAVGWWSGGEAIPFVKRLFGRETLTVRLEPHTSAAITPVFHIAGLEETIQPLREACNW